MGVYLKDELDTLTAQPIIDRLMKTVDEIQHNIFTNYIQNYTIASETEKVFYLDYIPLENSMFIMINGVAYTNNDQYTFFTYNSVTNAVKWVYEDIPMESGFRLAVIYSFDLDVNGVSSVSDVLSRQI